MAIITTKPQWAIPDTLAWLAALELPLREVHITSDKPSVVNRPSLPGPPRIVNVTVTGPARPPTS